MEAATAPQQRTTAATNSSWSRFKGSLKKTFIPSSDAIYDRAFAPFGQVVHNPAAHHGQPALQHTSANQGTATKWLDVSNLDDWYALAPSKKPARAVVNLFVCSPRKLEERTDEGGEGGGGRRVFPVKVLERHPFTPQTFIPMGVSAADHETTRYLVIVAPTLKPTGTPGRARPYPAEKPTRGGKSLKERLLGARPNPFTNDFNATTTPPGTVNLGQERRPKGPGEPDLDRLQAFIARGDQAVTYGPGTWHAPMVVLGEKDIDFVVVQYANGVAMEDCQEMDVKDDIAVDVDGAGGVAASAPGIMRAKL